MKGESLRCIVAADTEGLGAPCQWPPEITAEIRFVDPRFSLANDCYGIAWNAV
jgi:hypothetical protein